MNGATRAGADQTYAQAESRKFPEIAFRSSRVEKLAEGRWKVEGMLTLHGVTKPVVLGVNRDGDAYVSHATIKQTDFGIEPIRVAGGVIKVKNEVEIDVQIVQRHGE